MAYAILRTKKLKSFGSIVGSGKHTYREQDTPNADQSRLSKNIHRGAKSAEGLAQLFRSKMPEKVRKNAVLGIEYLITASPEKFNDPNFRANEYFKDSIKWLQKKHGKENVLAVSVHNDETTPHLVAYVIPKDKKGKLNCREFLGGRTKLSAMQTDFAKSVAHHGLERGIKGSRAKHKTIKQFYAELNAAATKHLKNKPTKRDDLLAVFGFKTKRKQSYEDAVELSAAAQLEARLDAQRASDVVDQSEEAYKQMTLKAERERENYLLKKMEVEREIDYLNKVTKEVGDSPQLLKAAERLNQELKKELHATRAELARYKPDTNLSNENSGSVFNRPR